MIFTVKEINVRVKIILQAPRPQVISINYNYYLSSLIYYILRESDVNFSTYLHSEGYSLGNKNFKLFCFSRLFPGRYSVRTDKLVIEDKIEWYVSSPITKFIFHLADGLLTKKTVTIGQGTFYVHSAEMTQPPEFTNDMLFRSLSPITTHTAQMVEGQRKTISCAVSEPKFIENIKNNLLRKYFLVHGSLPDNLSLHMQIDKRYLQDRGKLILYKNTRIKGYQVPFRLKGDRKIMKIAYDCGVGEKNSAGMGCVEIIGGR